MSVAYTVTSQNFYMLSGTASGGLRLDSSNALSGTVLGLFLTYDDGTYDDATYTPCALYEGIFDLTKNNKVQFSWTSTGDSGDIKFQFAESDNYSVWTTTAFTAWANAIATKSFIVESRYIKLRFAFESSLWTDSDMIAMDITPAESILSQIKKHKMYMFRRLWMKRRLATTGEYETDWQRVPDADIIKFGTIQYSVDDVIPNFYKFGGTTIELTNSHGQYSNIEEDKSFFYGALTVPRTLVKIEAGYLDKWGNEFPSTPTIYVGIITDNPTYKNDAKVSYPTKHLSAILDEFPADQIPGLGTTQTASQIITKIRDYQDGAGVYLFQKYITSGGWIFTATTKMYNMATTTNLQGLSCWGLLQKLSVAEDYAMYMSNIGNFYFVDKSYISASMTFHFSGLNDPDRTYGHNIGNQMTVVEDLRNVYNRIKIKHDEGDTTTSFLIRNESWTWGAVSSSSFLYGVKEYKYDNTFLDNNTASTLADTLYNTYAFPKTKIDFIAKFVPHLNVNESVSITYRTEKKEGAALWDHFVFGVDRWGERLGYNINLDSVNAQIVELSHNVDSFTAKVKLREI